MLTVMSSVRSVSDKSRGEFGQVERLGGNPQSQVGVSCSAAVERASAARARDPVHSTSLEDYKPEGENQGPQPNVQDPSP